MVGKSYNRLKKVYLGHSEDRELLCELLDEQYVDYFSKHRKHIFCTCDEKLYAIVQQFKSKAPNVYKFFILILDPH